MALTQKKDIIPFRVSPMLATLADRPFHKPNWIYEEKYDGIRILAYKEGNRVSLLSRNDKNRTKDFPDIVGAIANLGPGTLLLDGEIVVFDFSRISRFQLLQQGKGPTQYAVFDCLYADGEDLRRERLSVRRKILEHLVRPSNRLMVSSKLAEDGMKAFQVAKRKGFEGVVAKNLSSVYVERRSPEWLKVKVNKEEEFVIGGFTAPAGSRQHFGALLLGVYDGNKLRYVGKVGTGFDESTLSSLRRKFQRLIRKDSPFASDIGEKNATFLSPQFVAQVSFTERTKDGKLRHPVYVGLRDDKEAKEVVPQGGLGEGNSKNIDGRGLAS
jgi:bifunctional non-homologous end joining protein LigD